MGVWCRRADEKSQQTQPALGHSVAQGRASEQGNNSNSAAITFMLASMFLFAANDAIGKWLIGHYPLGELIMLRNVFALIVLAFMVRRGGNVLRFRHLEQPLIQVLRIFLVAAEVGCFYWAVRYLPLADVSMFYLASPLFLTIFSVVILKEKVGPRRWAAVTFGFVGVVLVFPPSEAALSLPALIALGGSISLALMLTLARMLRETSGINLITLQTIGVTILGGLTLPFAWVTPSLPDLGLIAVLALLATPAHFLMNKSVAIAAPAVVAPFQYSMIIWAIMFGYFVWGDFPSVQALIGAAMIVGAGLVVLYLELRAKTRSSINKG